MARILIINDGDDILSLFEGRTARTGAQAGRQGQPFDDCQIGSGQHADQALRRLSDRLRERRGPATG